MGYKSDFRNADGWTVADTNRKMIGKSGRKFRDFLKDEDVNCVIRYYASSERDKTLSKEEAELLSGAGFHILPIYQDNNREPEDFGRSNGERNARSALVFAEKIGQPEKSAILFSVDTDFSADQVQKHVVPYFEALNEVIGQRYRIGAYSSGHTLDALLDLGLISVPWLSMSRGFLGTKEFFYEKRWFIRQVPPEMRHEASGFGYDRNILRVSLADVGAFVLPVEQQKESTDRIGLPEAAMATTAAFAPAAGTASSTATAVLPVNMFVKTEGLNLRDAPGGNIIQSLTLADPVHLYGIWDQAGWNKVNVKGRDGFVFGKYLRTPAEPHVEALLQGAVAQWVRFSKGQGDEKVDPYKSFVREMWQSIDLPHDGASVDEKGDEIAWSAAFISFVVRNADPAYSHFAFHQRHSFYANDAIQSRILNRTNRPFWGYRIDEVKPALGDIIVRNRIPSTSNISFDYAENHASYKSHADFVVEIADRVVRVLGGNVGDTVSMESIHDGDNLQEYELDANGYLVAGQKIIAVLKNRVTELG